MAAGRVKSISGEADGASAVAHELDTSATYSTSGAKLLSVKNATTEKFAIDKDGNMTISGTIPGAALNPTWSTYTPTVTATGAGTPPQYTTNIGYYMQIGKIMFVEVKLSGDGGNEGSGVDQLQVAIPAALATGHHMGYYWINAGIARNGASNYFQLQGIIDVAATTVRLAYFSTVAALVTFSCNNQADTDRMMSLFFSYPVD